MWAPTGTEILSQVIFLDVDEKSQVSPQFGSYLKQVPCTAGFQEVIFQIVKKVDDKMSTKHDN